MTNYYYETEESFEIGKDSDGKPIYHEIFVQFEKDHPLSEQRRKMRNCIVHACE